MSKVVLASIALALTALALVARGPARAESSPDAKPPSENHRSPIALALSADGSRLLTANQASGSVSLVDPRAGKVLAETATGDKPSGVALSADGQRGVVVHWYGYDLAVLDLSGDKVAVAGRVEIGPEPRGVALTPDGATAFVTVGVANEVVRVDLAERKVTGRLEVGREPRGIALSPDGRKLLVGNARGRSVSLIDVPGWKVEKTVPFEGDNLRQVTFSADGKTGYVTNMKNRRFATTKGNIDIGWVLGQRVSRFPFDDPDTTFEGLSLDPQGKAASDVHGIALSKDGRFLVVSSAGTHEVFLFRNDSSPLPWRSNGSRDLMAAELLQSDGRFRRLIVGGRPTELAFAPDDRTVYVANYLTDAVQAVDVESGELTATIALGGPKEPSLVRRGEVIFYDGQRSFNQWYSCATCHSDGHTNGLDFDTMNDGWHDFSTTPRRSRKKVPTLRGVARTGPWTWHGWQTSLESAMIESFTKSMQGTRPNDEDVKAIVAYLSSLEFPKNPYRLPDGSLTPEAQRGQTVFRSAKAACSTCHGGPEFTDGKVHDVGLGERGDVYKGHNPPSLIGVYDKDPFLHDGRAKTLRDALADAHSPEAVSGGEAMTDQEMSDLIAYLKSL